MKFEIKNWMTGGVIFSIETENWRLAVEAAVKSSANLRSADLRYADLSSANLRSANLRYADLSSANLRYADLRYADLRYANLSSANLRYADLSYANLRYANLSSANLSSADLRYANLSYADLRYANLSYANLSYADLSYANLSYANLSYADLRSADLRYADLSSANLRSANLRSAKGVNKNLVTPLRLLLDQPGPVWAYKLVAASGEGPFARSNGYAPINYIDPKVEEFSVEKIDSSEEIDCGAGISLASLDWCMKEWKPGYRILIMEFFANEPKGNLVVPIATDGKFRVKQCRRVGEKDLKELGLVK